ncbi:MAG: hypothetical protein KDA81_06160 [Planctomycetaceae bacterium]|nr:hypothetical protein [Planctomycetaceae bacterium]
MKSVATTDSASAVTDHATRSQDVRVDSLNPLVRQVNAVYLRHVESRSLLPADQLADRVGQRVVVFLRHDRIRVFTVVHGDSAGMADFVSLSNVQFHVDAAARQQSNAGAGPLPNTRTVHAFLTGRLEFLGDEGSLPCENAWQPVVYHPLHHDAFMLAESNRPVWSAASAKLAPGRLKVWVPRSMAVVQGDTDDSNLTEFPR